MKVISEYEKQEDFSMTAFLGSFIEYLGKAVIYAVLAFAGVKAGMKLRDSKDSKTSAVRINNGKK